MSLLNKAKSQPLDKSHVSIFYGTAGVGKTEQVCKLYGLSTTAYFNLEKGWHEGIKGVKVFEREDFPTLKDMYSVLNELMTTKHAFKSIVIDSLTALQYYFYAEVMESGQTHIEGVDYSKAHKKAAEEAKKFMQFLQGFKPTGIEVIIVAHSAVLQFNDPRLSAPYNLYRVDTLYKDMTDIVVKFSDNVAFCYHDTEQVGKDGKHKIKMSNEEVDRKMLFEFRAFAPDAKNRIRLPSEILMDKEALNLQTALMTSNSDPNETLEQVKTSINELLKQVDANTIAAVEASLKRVTSDDINEFKRIKNKLLAVMKSNKGV